MAKLTDRQKKQIIAEYAENKGKVSYASLGRRYNVSTSTIKRVLHSDPTLTQKVTEIKNDNSKSMLEYLINKAGKAQNLLDMLLDLTETDIKKASLRDRMGAVKIIAETFGVTRGDGSNEGEPTTITVEIVDNGKKD